MKHKDNRQTPAAIYPAHKQKYNQADDIHAAPEVTEKGEHSTLGGKGFIDDIGELVIQDRDDNIGQQRQEYKDSDKGGFLYKRDDVFEFLYDRAPFFCLLFLFVRE